MSMFAPHFRGRADLPKKMPLGIRLKSTRPSHGHFWPRPLQREAKQNLILPGLLRGPGCTRGSKSLGHTQARGGGCGTESGFPSVALLIPRARENGPRPGVWSHLGSTELKRDRAKRATTKNSPEAGSRKKKPGAFADTIPRQLRQTRCHVERPTRAPTERELERDLARIARDCNDFKIRFHRRS